MSTFQIVALFLLSAFCANSATVASETVLVTNGHTLPIVTRPSASARVRAAALTLAQYLTRISRSQFNVVTRGNTQKCILVGTAAEFPELTVEPALTSKDSEHREDYLLRSEGGSLLVVGTTDLAVENAVWDVLYRLGYRQYFPGPDWEVLPNSADLRISVHTLQHPSYLSRAIWYGGGLWDYNNRAYADWVARNRMNPGIVLNTGHAYGAIIRANQAEFDKHPEYLALVNGQRVKVGNFCTSNAGLRKLVVNHALKYFKDNPNADSISMEPTDGNPWCECEHCRFLGGPTDRALLLANEVADAVNQVFPGKLIGLYAYAEHSLPPTFAVHPNVVVSIATAFNKLPVDTLVQGWSNAGATLGIREYYSVYPWDHDLPGSAAVSDPDYLKARLPRLYQSGARFITAESGDNWAPNGLGYYIAARLMWDITEADRVDTLIEDFLNRAFGTAKDAMRQFYELIDKRNKPLLSHDLIGRMYRILNNAKAHTQDGAVAKRIDDLILYARYVELYFEYVNSTGQTRQDAFARLVQHAYRMRDRMMVHTKAIYIDLIRRDPAVRIPQDAVWDVAEEQNPWKHTESYAQEEIKSFVTEGGVANPLRGFDAIDYGTDLLPAAVLNVPRVAVVIPSYYVRGKQILFTWADQSPSLVRVAVTGGVIYKNSSEDVSLRLFAVDHGSTLMDEARVPQDRTSHPVCLNTTRAGLQRLEIDSGADGAVVNWGTAPMTALSSLSSAPLSGNRWTLYFYVPKKATVVGGYASGPGDLCDADGHIIYTFASTGDYFSVPVAVGQGGKLWKFSNSGGYRMLMTVPPYLVRSENDLLLPRSVIEQDRASPRRGQSSDQSNALEPFRSPVCYQTKPVISGIAQ